MSTSPKSTITVSTTPAYPIIIHPSGFATLSNTCLTHFKGKRLGIVTQPELIPLYANSLKSQLESAGFTVHIISIPHGESTKTISTIEFILDELIQNKFERIDGLLALGGGVVGDITGFAASIYLRGIAFAQIPTTLLAQVDAAIGGKTGVNHTLGKNLIGTFYQPKFVFIDPKTLTTLSKFEWKSGMAEIVKYGIIQSKLMFDTISTHIPELKTFEYETCPDLWTQLITQSCQCKADVVSADEKESNIRETLNYGHTLGHAIETQFNYSTYSHGEAIAIGMVAAARMAQKMGLCNETVPTDIEAIFRKLGFETLIKNCPLDELIKKLSSDKKVRNNHVRWVLPSKIGNVSCANHIPENILQETIKEMITL